MNIFWNEYSGFCFELNFELNHFSAPFNEKMNFQNVSPRARCQSRPFFPIFRMPNTIGVMWQYYVIYDLTYDLFYDLIYDLI